MRRLVTTIGAMTITAVLTGGSSVAQAQDLTAGYQFQHFSGSGDSENAPAGFDVEFTYPITAAISVDAGVDYSHHG
jgi:hypothetical protein